MSRVLPILFNGDMVRATLDGRKTVTRRVVKYRYSNTEMKMRTDKYGTRLIEIEKDVTWGRNDDGTSWHKLRGYIEPKAPCQPGDILYVRETWNYGYIETSDIPENSETWFEPAYSDCGDYIKALSGYFYKADVNAPGKEMGMFWRPSIHMPKAAARIWLKVTDVRVERLQDITDSQILREGCDLETVKHYIKQMPEETEEWIHAAYELEFSHLWDSTIKKSDLARYGWEANPWVWIIEFERCGKLQEEDG